MTKNCPKVIRTIEDWDNSRPVYGSDLRQCVRCGEPTFWRTARQPKHGRCQDCQPWVPVTREIYDAVAARALDLLLDAFPDSDMNPPQPPDDVPRWFLRRMYWPVAQRWDQQWVWATPREVRAFNSFNRRAYGHQ